MAKKEYAVVGGERKKIKKKYAVVGDERKKIKKEYAVIGGERKLIYSSSGIYYAVNTSYQFCKSDDGETWEVINTLPDISSYSTNYSFNGIDGIACIGKIIVIPINSINLQCVYSLDGGYTWGTNSYMYYESGGNFYYKFYPTKIVSNGKIFVALMYNYEAGIRIVYSTNGFTWTRVSNNQPSASTTNENIIISSLSYTNNMFTWEGNVVSSYSIDGVNWYTNLGGLISSDVGITGTKLVNIDNTYIGIIRGTKYYYYRTGIDGTTTFTNTVLLGNAFDIVVFKGNVYILTTARESGIGGESATSYIYKIGSGLSVGTRVLTTETGANYTLGKGLGNLITNDDVLFLRLTSGDYYKTTDGTNWTKITATGNSKMTLLTPYIIRSEE